MNEHEVIVAPKTYKRVIALLVDFIVCIQFFAFFQFLITPILNNNFNYQGLLEEYQNKLVEHGLGYYEFDSETNSNIYVSYEIGDGEGHITQEKYDNASATFKNDSLAMEISNKVTTISMIGTSVELFLAILPNYLLFPLLFKNGQTLGKKIMKIAITDKNGCKLRFHLLLMRNVVGLFLFDLLVSYLCIFIINIPLVILVSIAMALFSKEKRTIHDLIANTYVVDEELSIIYSSLGEKNSLE